MTLILVLSVMNGFKSDFEKLIIGTRPHITIYPENSVFMDIDSKISSLKSYKEVGSMQKVTGGEGVISFNGKTSGVMIKGVEKGYFNTRDLLQKSIVEGKFQEGEVVLGIEIAKKLGVKVGDTVTVLSSKMRQTLFGSLPIHKSYKVSGFFKVDMYIYDSTMIYVSLKDASSLILDNADDSISNTLEVTLNDAQDTDGVYKIMLNNPFLQGSYVTNWKTDNQSFIDAIATQTAVMFLILSAFLIVSSFIMFSTLSSIVNEKKRSIAILQSFGASNKEIMGIFIIFGSMVSIPGILLGATFGVLLSLNLEKIKNWLESATGSTIFDSAYYFLSYIPSVINWQSVIKTCIFAFALCAISIIIPAYRARKVLPHEALRWE